MRGAAGRVKKRAASDRAAASRRRAGAPDIGNTLEGLRACAVGLPVSLRDVPDAGATFDLAWLTMCLSSSSPCGRSGTKCVSLMLPSETTVRWASLLWLPAPAALQQHWRTRVLPSRGPPLQAPGLSRAFPRASAAVAGGRASGPDLLSCTRAELLFRPDKLHGVHARFATSSGVVRKARPDEPEPRYRVEMLSPISRMAPSPTLLPRVRMLISEPTLAPSFQRQSSLAKV